MKKPDTEPTNPEPSHREEELVRRGRALARELGPSYRRLKRLWSEVKVSLEQGRPAGVSEPSRASVAPILEPVLCRAVLNVEEAWVELSDSLSPRQLRRSVRRAEKERSVSQRGDRR